MNKNETVAKLMSKIKSDKRLAIIVAIGVIGIAMLVLSVLLPSGTDKNTDTENTKDETATYDDYEKETEKRLSELVSSIEGAGNTKVMITLDSGDENVYAMEEKNNTSEDSDSEENGYVIVNKDGDDSGLLLKVVEPEIRGVAVVCEGADSAQVRQEISQTVTAVLGISANRVNIAKMKNSNGG